MLNFNLRGHITPERKVPSTVEDIKTFLVDPFPNTNRLDLFQKYIDYSNGLKHLLGVGNVEQWINGSFVCNQVQNPHDIDLVSLITFEKVEELGNLLIDFKVKWSALGIDSHLLTVYPEGHASIAYTKGDEAYWYEHFSKTRRNHSKVRHDKGFLEINY
jgi:hypothetical protein